MLKQILLFIPVLFGLFQTLHAHFLWKVNTENPSYLYGTVHSSDSRVRDLPPDVIEALKSAVSFHPELEFSAENIGRLTAAMFQPGTEDLQAQLPAELWQRLVKATESAGIPAALLQRMPLQLVPLLLAAPPGVDFNKIVDVQIYQLASENGLLIRQLESVDEQIGIFQGMEKKDAIVFLKDALKEWESGFPTQEKILRLYSAGDLAGLQKFLDEELARLKLPNLANELIDQRNRRMVERLAPFLKKGGAFVAVGAAHMPGDGGLVQLLQKRGYKVERVELDKAATR